MGEKLAALIFKRSQLLYDIANCCYIEGDLLGKEEFERARMVQDVVQADNVDRITRIMDLSVSQCVERLYPFTKRELIRDRSVRDDVLENEQEYWIGLRLPEDFSATTVEYLEKLIHEFIVCRAMEEWMSITNPGKRDVWREKWEEAERELLGSLKRRRGRVRRPLSPF
ncbi:MAG: hypothetical protein J1E16_04230 [Muribaculaceae bacterium]|nr:hypothetical protein [Muribaculaceae bacterium]